jgi:splicing factor 3A subunit 3
LIGFVFKIAVPMSMEYEQFMRQLQETEDGEPLGKKMNLKKIISSFVELALASFTDEEGYGRFLDLHQSYEVYLNVKGLEVITFI